MTDRCELCALPLGPEHPHLFDRRARTIVCACDACAMLFDMLDATRYRRIRPLVRRLPAVTIDDAAWASLGVPVGLAFVSPTSSGDVIAGYPGPAGATLAAVHRDDWQAIVACQPLLQDLEPDIEAWLVNRIGVEPAQYRVSIDHCYRLAGLVRIGWSGIGGGPAVAGAITEFFLELEAQAA